MKKAILYIGILAAIISCETDVKFNNPTFEGQKNNLKWKADITQLTLDATNLTINAYHGLETVTLIVPAPTVPISKANPVTYKFGTLDAVSNDIKARYVYNEDNVVLTYTTGQDLGNGEFVITEYDFANQTISGSFRFNAIYQGDNTIIPKNVNFQQGFIYKIPIR